MKLKYLLTMDSEHERWDRRYDQWETVKYHNREEFDLDDKEGLTRAIATFIEEYPKGDYEVYIICDYRDWYGGNPEWETGQVYEEKIDRIKTDALKISKEIAEQKRLKQIEERNRQALKELETVRQLELQKLDELKAKYEQSS